MILNVSRGCHFRCVEDRSRRFVWVSELHNAVAATVAASGASIMSPSAGTATVAAAAVHGAAAFASFAHEP